MAKDYLDSLKQRYTMELKFNKLRDSLIERLEKETDAYGYPDDRALSIDIELLKSCSTPNFWPIYSISASVLERHKEDIEQLCQISLDYYNLGINWLQQHLPTTINDEVGK